MPTRTPWSGAGQKQHAAGAAHLQQESIAPLRSSYTLKTLTNKQAKARGKLKIMNAANLGAQQVLRATLQ